MKPGTAGVTVLWPAGRTAKGASLRSEIPGKVLRNPWIPRPQLIQNYIDNTS